MKTSLVNSLARFMLICSFTRIVSASPWCRAAAILRSGQSCSGSGCRRPSLRFRSAHRASLLDSAWLVGLNTMTRIIVIPVMLSILCARQAAGVPDGPGAQGTKVRLLGPSFRLKWWCWWCVSGTTVSRTCAAPFSDGRKSVKYLGQDFVVRSGAGGHRFDGSQKSRQINPFIA